MENTKKGKNLILKISAFVASFALIAYTLMVIFSPTTNTRTLVSNLFFAIPIMFTNFIIVYSYQKHNKNTMKSLLGFILSGLLMLSVYYAFAYFDPTSWFSIYKSVIFVIIVLFTINQFMLSHEHYSRPAIVFFNQILMEILVIMGIVGTIIDVVQCNDNPLIFISLIIFVFATMFIILDLEIKINGFKIIRELKGYIFKKSETTEDNLDEEYMLIPNGLFYALPWIVVAALALLVGFNGLFDTVITWGYSTRYLIFIIKIIALFVLVHSYKTHNKNIMKLMLGFLLGMLLFENVFEVVTISTSSINSLKSVVTMVMIIVNIIFLCLHLQLTKNHAGNTSLIKMMKVTYIIYAILTVITAVDCSIYYFMGQGNNYIAFMFKPLIWILGTLPVITAILTIDTRVNGFKIEREKKEEIK